jgi:VCBS repeat-containing protein
MDRSRIHQMRGMLEWTPLPLQRAMDSDTSDPATEEINVENTAPDDYDGSVEMDPCTTYYGNVQASDPDGDPVTFSEVTGPAHGNLVFNSDGSYAYTPNDDFADDMDSFTFVASDGIAQGVAADQTMNIRPPSVGITVTANQTCNLMDTTQFSIKQYPLKFTGGTFKLQMSGTGNGNWVDMGTGSTPSVVERVAGNFQAQAIMTYNGHTYTSQPVNVTVEFPDWNTIYNDAGAKAKMDDTWAQTLAFAENNHGAVDGSGNYPDNKREEMGYWITLDTTTGQYGAIPFNPTVLDNREKGFIIPGAQPPDNPVNPVLGVGGTYVVGLFHTHTPMTYRYDIGPSNTRGTGPSSGDLNSPLNVPGFVYDYSTSDPIPTGYAIDSPAKVYFYGPNKRSLG